MRRRWDRHVCKNSWYEYFHCKIKFRGDEDLLVIKQGPYPVSWASERFFTFIIQIDTENTTIVTHQREKEFTLTNVPDFGLNEEIISIYRSGKAAMQQINQKVKLISNRTSYF